MSNPPPWDVDVFGNRKGRCPVFRFIRKQGDANVRATIIRKMEHVAKFRFHDLGRPLVDTLDAPIKELIVDEQVRVLFACHREDGIMVMLEATRKKNGDVDPEAVRRAKENYEEWLETRHGVGIKKLKKALGMET
jgi:hypothetical protein